MCTGLLSAATIIFGDDTKLAVRPHIVSEIGGRVLKRHPVLFEERVHVEARLELEKAPHLILGERPGAVAFDRNRLECLRRQLPVA